MHGTMMKRMPIEYGQLLGGFDDVQGMLGMCILLMVGCQDAKTLGELRSGVNGRL